MNDIYLISDTFTAEELKETILPEIGDNNSDIQLKAIPNPFEHRGALSDPTVLVAVVAGVSGVISALITRIFKALENNNVKKGIIILKGKEGASVQVPCGISNEKLEELVSTVKQLDTINIISD